jgi:hypothetical protein
VGKTAHGGGPIRFKIVLIVAGESWLPLPPAQLVMATCLVMDKLDRCGLTLAELPGEAGVLVVYPHYTYSLSLSLSCWCPWGGLGWILPLFVWA